MYPTAFRKPFLAVGASESFNCCVSGFDVEEFIV